jgi:hypothetical protein
MVLWYLWYYGKLVLWYCRIYGIIVLWYYGIVVRYVVTWKQTSKSRFDNSMTIQRFHTVGVGGL